MSDVLTKTNTAELLCTLKERGVELCIEKDKLRIRSPKGVLTPALQEELALHKPVILEILRERQAADSPWVYRPKPNPNAQLRLFCFPFAGGGVATYRSWCNDLPPEVEVCLIQLPGRENRLDEPPCTDLEELLAALETALLPYLDKPFAFYGHSLGALLSFELAHRLSHRNKPPTHLFVSACTAPHLPRRIKQSPNLEVNFLNYARLVQWLHPWISTKTWLDLIFHPKLNHPTVLDKLLRPFGLDAPRELLQNPEFINRILPTIKADFLLADGYAYKKDRRPLDCPIVASGGEGDRICGLGCLEAWSQHTSGDFKRLQFPGGHLFLRTNGRKPLLDLISQELSKRIKP